MLMQKPADPPVGAPRPAPGLRRHRLDGPRRARRPTTSRPTAWRRRPARTCSCTPHNPVELVSLGPRGVREGEGREEADLPVGRLQLVLLVPRHGARELRGRRDRPVPQRAFRLHQGGPRGTPGRRPDLHDRAPGDRAGRRVADVDVPDARRPPVLRRDVPAAPRSRRIDRVPDAGRRDRQGLDRRSGRDRQGGRCPDRRGAAAAPRREGPARDAALAGLGRPGGSPSWPSSSTPSSAGSATTPGIPAGPSSPSRPTWSSCSIGTSGKPRANRRARRRKAGGRRPAGDGPRDARPDGPRGDPRPPGRRLSPLFHRSVLDRPAFREDALRQRPARLGAPVGVRGHRRPAMARRGRGDVRVRRAEHDRAGRRLLLGPRRRDEGRRGRVSTSGPGTR